MLSVTNYLASSYSPDSEYVDGRIVERNLGTKDHSKLQTALAAWFYQRRRDLNIAVFVEQRVQTRAYRFRVPDLCVTFEEPEEQVFTKPPYLCIEILSPDDRLDDTQAKASEYLAFGVPYVWVIDPATLTGWIHQTGRAVHHVSDGLFGEPYAVSLRAL